MKFNLYPFVAYDVEVHTGTVRGAGTDANVFITLFGDKGDTPKLKLDGPGNLFESGQVDRFKIEVPLRPSTQHVHSSSCPLVVVDRADGCAVRTGE